MINIWFHRPFFAKVSTNLSTVARIYGPWYNPGPIVAYPPNKAFFKSRLAGDELVRKGDRFAIPWSQEKICKQITFEEGLIRDKQRHAARAMKSVTNRLESVQDLAVLVDVIGAVATILVGGVALAKLTHKALNATNLAKAERIATKMAAGSMLTMPGVGVVASLSTHADKKEAWHRIVCHVLGVASPSKWFTLAACAWVGDYEMLSNGPKAMASRNLKMILTNLTEQVATCQLKIAALEKQTRMPFYKHVI